MTKRVGILHTSLVFINRETMLRDLLDEALGDDVELVDFIDSEVLASVMRAGAVTDASVERMRHLAEAAVAADVDVIFSACSSLGPAMDRFRDDLPIPLVKIDEAMARTAAGSARDIGVLATVPTTLGPTSDLIRQAAEALGRDVQVHEQLCEGAFELLMAGATSDHDERVVATAATLAEQVEIVVLAQASMTRLAPRIEEGIGLPVLSSPRLGVEDLARVLTETTTPAPA